ncbi:MAG TPA: hypothetical protein VGD59_10010 [Acidisarcina sp.]
MPRRRARILLLLMLTLLLSKAASAHPMGNFSVNHYSKISLEQQAIRIEYLIDLAEIPTYQELQQGNIKADAADAVVTRYIASRGAELGRGLTLTLDGRQLPLRLQASQVIFPPGAGGLPTMKMGFVFEASYPAEANRKAASLRYSDANYEGHTGWKEIIAVAPAGSLLSSSVPAADRSAELSNYPTDLLSSPPQVLDATLQATLPAIANAPLVGGAGTKAATRNLGPGAGGAAMDPAKQQDRSLAARTTAANSVARLAKPVSDRAIIQPSIHTAQPYDSAATRAAQSSFSAMHLKANEQLTPRSRFTELITEQNLSPWFLFTAAFIAMGLGALHALEPGHGKTIVGAYLVGSRGTARHAVLLGLIVTLSHTAGVFALGVITLYASHYIVPEQLYPWLGVFSGITIAALGCYMLLRRLAGTAVDHSHAPGATHTHWYSKATTDEALEDTEGALQAKTAGPVSLTQLFTLGITGGIIPCPAALIVLLSAFALHRVGLGFFLIVAFSLGLAAVLIGFGMLMVSARRFMTRLQVDGPLTKRWLPAASACFITILGMVLAFQAFAATRFNVHMLSKEKLGPLLFVTGLGLILGMRHSTDADHVVAISTIVTRQRGIRNAAFIGSVWGLGHTITIFVVGALIILFGVEIPPRVGLSMEFCVAIMLVLLGVLNLTGVMQKLTTRWTRTPLPGTPALTDRTGLEATLSDQSAAAKVSSAYATESTLTTRLLDRTVGRFGFYQFVRPLVIGLVHGLAGSAAVALLVLSTIHSPLWATFYLLIFGAGTMLGMMCMTAAMAVPLSYAGDRFSRLSRYMGVASGMVSLCFGSFLVYQLGYVGGLFTSHPEWTPR